MKALTKIDEPPEWDEKQLRELVSFEKGRVVTTQPYETTGALPYIGAENFGGAFTLYTTEPIAVVCEPSDILMLWDGDRSGLCSKNLQGAIGSTVARLRPLDAVDGGYLYHQLTRFFPWIQARRTGTGVPHVPKDLGGILWLPVPKDEEEQRRIAAVLDTVDKAIAKTEAVIAKLRQIRAGLVHDLLTRGPDENGSLRNPMAHPEKFQDSPFGRIPEEWTIRHLTEITTFQNGKSFPSTEYRDNGIRLLRPGNLPPAEYVSWEPQSTIYLPESWAEAASEYLVGEGEVVMNLTAQSLEDQFLGRVCITRNGECCLLNQRLARFRATDCHLPFLFWSLRGPQFRLQIDRTPKGTKIQHLYNRDLESIILPIPNDLEEQERIASTLFMIAAKIESEEIYLAKLVKLKSGLMLDLLAGRVRVPEGII